MLFRLSRISFSHISPSRSAHIPHSSRICRFMSSTSASASVPSLITSPAFHPHAPHILVSVPIAHSALHRLFQRCQVTYRPIEDTNQIITPVTLACGKMNADEIRQQCKEKQFSGLVVFAWDRVDAALMDLLPNVKCISTSSVGYDHIDIPAATQRSILIGYTPGILTETCADLTVGLILATSRRLVEAVQVAKSGAPWGYLYSKDVHSSTVGFVGLGRIGVSTARRLRAFNCRIIYSGPREKREEAKLVDAEYVSFDELLKQSDFVVPQCPLNNQTRHMFGKDAFQKMKPDAIFINTTRGGVVNQDALYEALKNGTILGAGLDVTDPEPLPPSHPLFTLPNAVILPHIASATLKCRAAMANMAVDNLLIALGEMDRDGVKGTYVNQHEIKQR